MDTPEQEQFLETIRGLRKEAEEKLTGNRHYLAIQKLDEIAEAVEQRAMSSQELGAVNDVLRGGGLEISEAPIEAPATIEAPAEEIVELDASVEAAPVEVAVAANEVNVLPNWWRGSDKEAAAPATEPAIAAADTQVEENSIDLAGAAAVSAVAGVAAAAVAGQFSAAADEPVEIEVPEIVEKIEQIEIPEIELEASDVESPAIMIDASELEVEQQEVAPIVEAEPLVEIMPEVVVEEPVAIPDVAVLPEVALPEVVLPEVVLPEVEENIELEVPAVLEEEPVVEVETSLEAQAEMPEVVVESAPAEIVVEDPPGNIIIEDVSVPDVETNDSSKPDTSANIADLLSDGEIDTQAVAAGAAAAAVIGAAGSLVQGESTQEERVLQEVVEPESIEAPAETVTADPAATILTGENLGRHPKYGGNRGGIFRRFANSLRGKDYL